MPWSTAMSIPTLTSAALASALHLRDLSDPQQGPHAMQRLVADVAAALQARWGCAVQVHRPSPVVSVSDNYDQLGYPPGGAARDARYTRYVTDRLVLRTQTSAAIPGLLRALSASPPADLLLAVPGLVYRRDVIDRLHVGEPHQLDLWRLRAGPCGEAELEEMIRAVVETALPGRAWRVIPRLHPYTCAGRQIDVAASGGWIEIGECGLADPALLRRCGVEGRAGLAMGLGLDRLLMIRKEIPDIRLLREDDPRIAQQMLDLRPYRPLSDQPAIRRDLSLALDAEVDPEILGDRVREALGEEAGCVEEVQVLSQTPYAALPPAAVARMGIRPSQQNVLLRLVIRHPARTLTSAQANALRDRVYLHLHEGDAAEMTETPAP